MATNAAIPSDAGTNRGVYDSLEAIRSLLIPGETIEAMAIQRRVFALRHRRTAVAATSGRLIVVQRRLFGGYTPIDIRWQDLHESALQVGVFGATLTVSAYANQSDLAIAEGAASGHIITGLRKTEAQEVYRICQTHSQAWREKRRIRELEEMRARAGGIQVGALGGGGGGYAPTGNGTDQSPTARLQRAKEMRESGLLNDAEFAQIKAKILAEL
jgi:hypothetical protein